MSTTELHWHPATTPPDADITVLCWLADGEWHSGWWAGDVWRDCASGGVLEVVTHWAEPQGPAAC
jgi:hypothetical protein